LREIIIPDTIETATIMFTAGASGIAMTGLAIGSGIESRLAIVPMITTVGMGTIPDGTTDEMTGVGNLLRQSDSLSNGVGKS
jgi:hypothetical protein